MSLNASALTASFSPLKGLGKTCRILIGVVIFFRLVDCIFSFAGTVINAAGLANLSALLSIIGNLAAIFCRIFELFSFAYFIVWARRAFRNLPLLGASGARSKEWYVTWGFLIPFANLILPFLLLNEVWKGSDPDKAISEDWQQEKNCGLINVWWALVLLTAFANMSLALFAGLASMPEAVIVAVILQIVSSVLAIAAISKLSLRQDKRFENIRAVIAQNRP
ncbi:MAG: DUF4328 domain-containing protein [Candidatus Obscuribacterales bacterium]|nr:DUF4328 domain-containing protein [Candidatus Obscuribacterales bacterium]